MLILLSASDVYGSIQGTSHETQICKTSHHGMQECPLLASVYVWPDKDLYYSGPHSYHTLYHIIMATDIYMYVLLQSWLFKTIHAVLQ